MSCNIFGGTKINHNLPIYLLWWLYALSIFFLVTDLVTLQNASYNWKRAKYYNLKMLITRFKIKWGIEKFVKYISKRFINYCNL